MPVFLEAIAVENYRGIGPETQYIAPFAEMNFFIGANNAGKSVVLKLISERLPFTKGANRTPINPSSIEAFRGKNAGSFDCAVGLAKATATDQVMLKLDAPRLTRLQVDLNETSALVARAITRKGAVWLR